MEITEVIYELRRRRCMTLDSLYFIRAQNMRAKVLNISFEPLII